MTLLHKKIDIIIPVYNGEDFIEEALSSVIKQTYKPENVFVINDGSTDKTKEIVEKYAHTSPISITLIQKENGGLSSARNRGIKESTAEYIAFLDADDVWESTKLEEQMHVFENTEYPTLGLVYCGYDIINTHGIHDTDEYVVPLDTTYRGMVFEKVLSANKILSSGSGVLIKKEVFDTVGLFDETLRFGEDWDMWIRIAEKYAIDYTPQKLVHIRRHEESMTTNKPFQVFKGQIILYTKWIHLLQNKYAIPRAWTRTITLKTILRFPRTDFISYLKKEVPSDIYKALFARYYGSLIYAGIVCTLRQIGTSLFSYTDWKRIFILLKRKIKTILP